MQRTGNRGNSAHSVSGYSAFSFLAITHTYTHSREHRECRGKREERKRAMRGGSIARMSRTVFIACHIHTVARNAANNECKGKREHASKRKAGRKCTAMHGISHGIYSALLITSMHAHIGDEYEKNCEGMRAGAGAVQARENLRRNSVGILPEFHHSRKPILKMNLNLGPRLQSSIRQDYFAFCFPIFMSSIRRSKIPFCSLISHTSTNPLLFLIYCVHGEEREKMPPRKEISNLQDLVNRYRFGCGESIAALAQEAGVSRQTLTKTFGELGCLDLSGEVVKPKKTTRRSRALKSDVQKNSAALRNARDLAERFPVDRIVELYLQNLTLVRIAEILKGEGFPDVTGEHVTSILRWKGHPTSRGGSKRP